MTKELFLELVNKAHKTSSMYTFADIIDEECEELGHPRRSAQRIFRSDHRLQELL